MVKQAVTINFETGSISDKLRILHIWKTAQQLIVVSKLSSPSQMQFTSQGEANAEIIVDVETVLPVKHYIVLESQARQLVDMPEEGPCIVELASDYKPIVVGRENEIPESERTGCLYENELTDTKERIDTIVARANSAEKRSMDRFHQSLRMEAKNNPSIDREECVTIRIDLVNQVDHNETEIAILLSLNDKYNVVNRKRELGDLNDDEVATALSRLELSNINFDKLSKLIDKYKDEFEKKIDKRLSSAAVSPVNNFLFKPVVSGQKNQMKQEQVKANKIPEVDNSSEPESTTICNLSKFSLFSATLVYAAVTAYVFSQSKPSI
jgi:hypothetical protein